MLHEVLKSDHTRAVEPGGCSIRSHHPSRAVLHRASARTMETMQELIPFAKEMLSQKPNRKMVKMYVLGTVLTFFGVVIGLVETVVSPFTSAGQEEEEEEDDRRVPPPLPELSIPQKKDEIVLVKSPAQQFIGGRSVATRGHAS